MTVYVDELRLPPGRSGGRMWCHMMADTIQELHAMALAIGLRREWYQGDHYEMRSKARRKAISLGAIAITQREMVRVRQHLGLRRPYRCTYCGERMPGWAVSQGGHVVGGLGGLDHCGPVEPVRPQRPDHALTRHMGIE